MELTGEMPQARVPFDQDTISCSICLDILKDPVIIPCGHSYCKNCIKGHWHKEEEKTQPYSCPQCIETFASKPVPLKNIAVAGLVECLKIIVLRDGPENHCYTGPGDVSCDFCTGRKLKAVKSCLDCFFSFCEEHLNLHNESPIYEKHKLVDPSDTLKMNFCSCHNEAMKMFCRTDQRCICYLCSVEHNGHDIVLVAAERTEKQRELKAYSQTIDKIIQDREEDVRLLQQQVETISDSAEEAMKDIENAWTDMISVWNHQIRLKLSAEGNRVKILEEKLEKEITELKRKVSVIAKLSATEDDNQFLRNHCTLSPFSQSTKSSSISISSLRQFEDISRFMRTAVSEMTEKVQHCLNEELTEISSNQHLMRKEVFMPQSGPELKTRED